MAHTPDDLANPKPNVGKKGFTDEEREGFQNFLDAGFVDTFRLFHQGNGHYSWWSHFANARARNVGWRIDYFLVSESLVPRVTAAEIHANILGSDHCPISPHAQVTCASRSPFRLGQRRVNERGIIGSRTIFLNHRPRSGNRLTQWYGEQE